MRFAILGTRGIPARYGGFETFAEELSTRLAARGHRVRSIAASAHSEPNYRGVQLQYLPTIRHKYLDTIAHTFLLDAALCSTTRQDAVLYCNAANAVFTWMPRAARDPRGAERRRPGTNRKKWNRAGQGVVSHLRMAGDMDAQRAWSPMRRASPSIIANAIIAIRR